MPSKIEWTEETWNPLRARLLANPALVGWHCTHASEGCRFCYAEAMNRRANLEKGIGIGTGLDYKPGNEKLIEIFVDDAVLDRPRHWKRPRTIFAGSMTDLFAGFVTDAMLDRIMAIPAETPRHTYQFLTKRPGRMGEYIRRLHSCGQHALAHVSDSVECFPLDNCWMGTSVEDGRVRSRIDELREVPARVRFLSIEPLIGPLPDLDLRGIHLVIVGGESGREARPMHPDWVRSIRDQCAAAGVAFFFKQWGEWIAGEVYSENGSGGLTRCQDGEAHYGKPSHWWSGDCFGGVISVKIGKKAAGRRLDDRLHDEMPKVAA